MPNELDEAQDLAYPPKDDARRSLVRRVVTMAVISAVALPAAWSYDHRSDGAEQQLAAPPPTAATTVAVAPTVPVPEPVADTTTTAPADLPEIETAEDLARVTGLPLPEDDDEELPEITVPSRSSASDSDSDTQAASGEGPATTQESASGDHDDEATASTAGPADGRSGSAPEAEAPPTTAAAPETTPAPAPTTSAPSRPTPASTEEQIEQLIRDTFPADQHDVALRVARRESGFDPSAVSPSGCCVGIFQIHYTANENLVNGLGYEREDLFDPAANVAVGYALWQRSGWRPWSQTAY